MSHSMVPLNLVSAFKKSEDILGKDRRWTASNSEQVSFLHNYLMRTTNLSAFSPNELRSWIDIDADHLNDILTKEGFNIHLDDFGEDGFGVVSVLEILIDWITKGAAITIPAANDDKNYPGVFFGNKTAIKEGKEVTVFESFGSMITDDPVILIHTKSGDKVFMTIATEEVRDFKLTQAIEAIRGSNLTLDHCDTVTFPMLDYNKRTDLSWPLGMHTVNTDGQNYHVAQALQQTKFKMNQHGAHLKDVVAIGISRGALRQSIDVVIDQPFFLWIERPGVDAPVLYGYFDEQDWKDPGNLEL